MKAKMQRRVLFSLLAQFFGLIGAGSATGTEPELDLTQPQPAADPEPKPEGEPTLDMTEEEAASPKAKAKREDLKLGETRVSWPDILVVKRKPFLKMSRFELVPSWAITLNDNMIRHYGATGQINYYLTDVLAVGVEGQIFIKEFLETHSLVRSQDRRSPTLNEYNYGAALDFHYSPVYGKFAILNRKIVHWEGLFTAGLGITESEVLPRDLTYPSWTNMLITPNFGFSMRFFVNRWMTLNLGVRDYIFIDQYEKSDRGSDVMCAESVECSKEKAEGLLVNHVMFQAGLSFWFPMSFKYTTFR